MKSILQNIALLSSILLIVSCGGGGGSSSNVGVALPDPKNGVTGQVVKGAISGAAITVQDGTGAAKASTATVTTAANGSYSLTFTPAVISAGITGPLFVTAKGGATVCDYDDPASATNDCPVGDGTFVTFGSAYALPAGFELSGLIPVVPTDSLQADPIVTVNISPASDLAVRLAVPNAAAGTSARALTGVTAVTSAQAATAAAQVLGIIQAITGIDLRGQNLWTLPLVDLTNAGNSQSASAASIALSSFNAGIFALITGANTSIAAAILSVKNGITVNADGTVTLKGSLVSQIARAAANGLNKAAANGNTFAAAAADTAAQVAVIAAANPTGDFKFQQGGSSAPADSLATTRAFVGDLITAINGISTTTGAGGAGVAGQGPTELFAVQLRAADNAASDEARTAIQRLVSRLTAVTASVDTTTASVAVAATGDTKITGTVGVTVDATTKAKTITVNEGGLTSSWSNSAGTVTAKVTIPAGANRVTSNTEQVDSATGSITITGLTIAATQTANSTTSTLASFTGDAKATFADEGVGTDLGLKTLSLTGTLTGSGTTSASISLKLGATTAAPTGTVSGTSCIPASTNKCANGNDNLVSNSVTGAYELKIGFGTALSATVFGTSKSTTQNYSITAGGKTINGKVTRSGTQDTNVLTTGTTASCGTGTAICLTVVTDNATKKIVGPVAASGTTAARGEIKSGNTQTATVDGNGLVRYTDGTVQSLPGAI